MLRTEIDKDEPLYPGDKILMTFKAFGPAWVYLRASELALLKWQLSKDNPDWQMTAWDAYTYPDKLLIEFVIKGPPIDETPQVLQAGIFTTAAVIGALVVGAGLFTWLSLVKVEKIVGSPAGKIALAGTGSLGIAVLVIAVLLLLRRYQD